MKMTLVLVLFSLMVGCENLQEKKSEVSALDKMSKKEVSDVEEKKPDISDALKTKSEVVASNTSMNRVIVSVPGMVCQMCVHGMRKVFKNSVKDAEKDVQVDLAKKTVTLNLMTALSDAEIKKKVIQAGYKADNIQRL